MKEYGDEEFIYLIKEEESGEVDTDHVNQIQDGYIYIDDEQILFKETVVSEDEFSMILPVIFEPMPENLVEIKYPSVNRPDFILSNPETTINLNFSHKADSLANEEAEEFKNIIQEGILRMNPSSNVIDSSIIEVEQHNIAYFDFITPAVDTEIYNLMFFFSLEERLLMGSFNCIKQDMYDWKEIFIQMLQSIKYLK